MEKHTDKRKQVDPYTLMFILAIIQGVLMMVIGIFLIVNASI